MNLVTHGLVGVAVLSPLLRHLGRSWKWTLAVVAFVLGIAPDVLPWAYYNWLGVDRWTFYSAFHEGAPWWLLVVPPYGLHVVMDLLTHTSTGGWLAGAYVLDVLFAGLAVLVILRYSRIGRP